MDNNNNNTGKAGMQQFAKRLRELSSGAAENKGAIAGALLDKAAKFVKVEGKWLAGAETLMRIWKVFHAFENAVVNDPGVRQKTATLIENSINDICSRVNEFSGLVDYISKSEDLAKEFEAFEKAWADSNKILGKKGFKFSVVKDKPEEHDYEIAVLYFNFNTDDLFKDATTVEQVEEYKGNCTSGISSCVQKDLERHNITRYPDAIQKKLDKLGKDLADSYVKAIARVTGASFTN